MKLATKPVTLKQFLAWKATTPDKRKLLFIIDECMERGMDDELKAWLNENWIRQITKRENARN